MRTLKKALSLVLVLAMVLSLGVTAFAVDKASQFSDYGNVTNKEAVDVLTAIGVINGNTDGTFGPSGNFTRAQAATMISYLTLGKTVANALPTGATQFNDVPATHWAAKYVQYCANEGIINGYGDGKFGPDDKLTANQWALMLLGALGYKAANENIGGAGWEIQVTKLAMNAGVATADELVATFNRDMAAKMALNTLKADVVEYTGGSNITINGAVINQGATRKTVTTKDANGKNIKNDADAAGNYTVQFAEQHFPNLSISTSAKADAMGRPASVWNIKGQNDAVSTGAAAATLTYTATVKEADMVKNLKGYTYTTDLKAVVNSASAQDTTTNAADSAAAIAALTGNGKVVEIFANSDNKITDVVVTAPSFGQVTTKAKAETKTVGAYTEYTVGGTGYKVFSTVVNEDNDKTKAVISGTVENKDYVLYYIDGESVAHIAAVDTISGTVTAKSSTNVYTIDGTKYQKAAAFATVEGKTDIVVSKTAGEYYVDSYGYLLGVKSATEVTNYAFVISVANYKSLEDSKIVDTYSAVVATPDGTVETLAIDKASYTAFAALDGKGDSANSFAATPAVTYSDADNDGENTLTALKAGDNKDVYRELTGITAKALSFTTGDASSSVKYANANTKFVIANYETNAKNERVSTGTVTVYTGAANVPTYTQKAYAVDTDKNGIADVVFVLVDTTASISSDFVYVVGTFTDTATARELDVVIKGEETTIATSKDESGLGNGLYSKVVVKSDATIDGTKTKLVSADDDVTKYSSVKYSGGLLLVDTTALTCDADVAVYTIDSTDKTVSTTTADTLTEAVNGTIALTYAADGKTITAIYVVA